MNATIFAQATPPGRGGVAVFRISGRQAGETVRALTGRDLPEPRCAVLASLRDPDTGETLDRGLILWFPGPASYTGEDVAELHLHGGRAVAASLLDCLRRRDGLRLAEPGEFTRRAFEHGKLDLTQAEAVADLVDAETRAQQRQALRQMEGALGKLYDVWREGLVRSLAHLEAWLDFPDEDLPASVLDALAAELRDVRTSIVAHLDDNRRSERLREGVSVAIVGAPNVGKSSLMNRLARRDVALVSDRAGTTRDAVEVALDLDGVPTVLVDTAGLRETEDEIEQAGVLRARQRAGAADLRILMFDLSDAPDFRGGALEYLGPDSLCVINKADLASGPVPTDIHGQPALAISAATGHGVDALIEALRDRVAERSTQAGPGITRLRHRLALTETAAALDAALSAGSEDLIAEEVRSAVRSLGRITGRVGVEDLLDRIFAEFCIGK